MQDKTTIGGLLSSGGWLQWFGILVAIGASWGNLSARLASVEKTADNSVSADLYAVQLTSLQSAMARQDRRLDTAFAQIETMREGTARRLEPDE